VERLRSALRRIDGKSYRAYKSIKGSYEFGDYTLSVDHVQGDPYALASRISVYIPSERAGLPDNLFSTPIRKIALEDYLGRAAAEAIGSFVKGERGTGKGGCINIETSGQQVLLRNAVIISHGRVEARLTIGLPAAGRTILGRDAEEMFFRELPAVVLHGLCFENLKAEDVRAHAASVEDQEFLRSLLEENRLVAFVADGSILPRLSGIDDRPLTDGVIPFKTPESLSRTVNLPNRGSVTGMGIPEGISLIVGGGFHGKSTLLHALETGVYNHIPGDGRELVVTDPTAVKIRAEDGRAISGVNISPYIDNLPFGRDSVSFTTGNASGSTSQAANIVEALEQGAKTLLIDEDTSATNFMVRDERMQKLVLRDKEPITPFLHRVREMYENMGVSTIIVMGGVGDYFEVSDRVILMDSYKPEDVTEDAHSIAGVDKPVMKSFGLKPFDKRFARRVNLRRLSPRRGRRDVKIDARAVDKILFGENLIDLAYVEQLVDMGQTLAVALMIYYYLEKYSSKKLTLAEGLRRTVEDVEMQGLDILSPYKVGNLALPRLHELAAAINRIRL